MKKKLTLTDIEREELKEKDVIFCTECDNQLEVFGIENGSFDVESVRQNFNNCKATGKFKGDVCSKLFIISEIENSEDECL